MANTDAMTMSGVLVCKRGWDRMMRAFDEHAPELAENMRILMPKMRLCWQNQLGEDIFDEFWAFEFKKGSEEEAAKIVARRFPEPVFRKALEQ